MKLGIDFDNTIVCYDKLFYQVALEQELIGSEHPRSKAAVRDTLREQDKEDAWTRMQGYVYGKRMPDAAPYPGVLHFIKQALARNLPVFIISHKTRHPFIGPRYDLHESARQWLNTNGLTDPSAINLPPQQVFFELTKEEKIERIRTTGCTHFIDDLPEFLKIPEFPENVERLLFDPNCVHQHNRDFCRMESWLDIAQRFNLSGK